MIRRAATELMCNMMMYPRALEMFCQPRKTDRLKLILALCDSEDYETRRAAMGIIATISMIDTGSESLAQFHRLDEIILSRLFEDSIEIQHRTLVLLLNLLQHQPARIKPLFTSHVDHHLKTLKKTSLLCNLVLNLEKKVQNQIG